MATPLPSNRGTSLLLSSPGLLSTPFGLALRSPEEGDPSPEIEVTVNEARLSLEQYMGMAGLIRAEADKGLALHQSVKDKVDSAVAESQDLIPAVWPSQQQQQKQGQKRSSSVEPTNHLEDLEDHGPSIKRPRATTRHQHQQDNDNGRHYLDTMRTLEEQVAKARKEVEHKEKAALAEEHETANAVKFAEQTWGALHQIHIMLQMGHTANTAANATVSEPSKRGSRLQQSIAAQQQEQWQMPGHARFPTSMMPNVEGGFGGIRSPFYGDLMEAIFMFSSPPDNNQS